MRLESLAVLPALLLCTVDPDLLRVPFVVDLLLEVEAQLSRGFLLALAELGRFYAILLRVDVEVLEVGLLSLFFFHGVLADLSLLLDLGTQLNSVLLVAYVLALVLLPLRVVELIRDLSALLYDSQVCLRLVFEAAQHAIVCFVDHLVFRNSASQAMGDTK